MNKSVLWSTYEQDSINTKGKAPHDLIRRKEVAWRRDSEKCNRCGTKTRLMESHIMYVKDIDKGGTYHFENITLLCSDCYRLLNSRKDKIPKDLKIQDELLKKALF